MTTDHNLIARACAIVGLVPCVHAVSGAVMAYCEREDLDPETRRSKGDIYLNNESLRALLVLRLQMLTGACIDYFPKDEGWLVMIGAEATEGIETFIDIIRVLVDALEGAG